MWAPLHITVEASDPETSIKVLKASEDDLHHAGNTHMLAPCIALLLLPTPGIYVNCLQSILVCYVTVEAWVLGTLGVGTGHVDIDGYVVLPTLSYAVLTAASHIAVPYYCPDATAA
jgi:hypothetical protein